MAHRQIIQDHAIRHKLPLVTVYEDDESSDSDAVDEEYVEYLPPA